MAKQSVAEAERDQKYWYGDLWPVTAVTTGAEHWIAWQLHRVDLDAGIVVAFRRKASPYPVIEMSLKGLKPEAMYRVEFVDESGKAKVKKMAGRELMEPTEVRVGKGQSLVVRYEPER
jgi:alpha-galactosidase